MSQNLWHAPGAMNSTKDVLLATIVLPVIILLNRNPAHKPRLIAVIEMADDPYIRSRPMRGVNGGRKVYQGSGKKGGVKVYHS